MSAQLLQPADAFATGCVMISVRGEQGRPRVVWARAFNSVSLTPAIVVWVLRSDDADSLEMGRACGISVVAGTQCDGAAPTARLMQWQPGEILGAPLATYSLASFEAVVIDRIDCGEEIVHFAQLASFAKCATESDCVCFDGRLVPSRQL